MSKYLSGSEIAKLVRVALKDAFPGVKFSVTTRRGGSVSVSWTDGPTREQVHAVSNRFEGKDFDGMTDSTSYRPAFEVNGQMVHSYSYVFESRHESAGFTRKVGEAYSQETGWPIPTIYDSGGFEWDYTQPVPGGHGPVAVWFNRKLWATAEAELKGE